MPKKEYKSNKYSIFYPSWHSWNRQACYHLSTCRPRSCQLCHAVCTSILGEGLFLIVFAKTALLKSVFLTNHHNSTAASFLIK